MATLNEFIVEVGANVNKQSFSRAQNAVKSFAQVAAGFLATGAFAVAVQKVADRFNDLGDVVSRVGNTTVKELDRLGYVAELTGSDTNTATVSFENLSRTIGEASQGIGRGAQVFEKLGLSARDSAGNVKTTSQVIDEVKAKISNLSRSEQVAYIQRLGLDRTLVGLLTSDTSEIESQYNRRTEALGLNVDEASRLGAEYNDSIKVVKRGFDDIITAFVVKILPHLTSAIEKIARVIDENIELIRNYIDPLSTVIGIGVDLISGFIVAVGKLFKSLGKAPIFIGAVAVAWKALNTIFSMSPIGRIIALVMSLITAIGLLIDDYETWKNGGISFFGDSWKSVEDFVNKIGLLVERAKALFLSFIDSVKSFISDPKKSVEDFLNWISEKLSSAFDSIIVEIPEKFSDAWDALKNGFLDCLNEMLISFGNWFNEILNNIKNLGGRIADSVKNSVKNAWSSGLDSVKNLFSFDTKKSLPPSVINNQNNNGSTYDNSNRVVNQTINVNSAKEAQTVAVSTNRQMLFELESR